jgi:hypothetical protein
VKEYDIFLPLRMPRSRQDLIRNYSSLSNQLRAHGIRRISDYAEVLIAEALDGERVSSGVNKGFDVIAPGFGKIEVKYRQLPPDGRMEQRVELGRAKCDGFDYLAIVIFDCDMHVHGAVLVPYNSVWEIVESRTWRRINYDQASAISGAINITVQVIAASQR